MFITMSHLHVWRLHHGVQKVNTIFLGMILCYVTHVFLGLIISLLSKLCVNNMSNIEHDYLEKIYFSLVKVISFKVMRNAVFDYH